MINYYKTQRLTIPSVRNVLSKMYGSYKTHIIVLDFEVNRLYKFMENINHTHFKNKFPIKSTALFNHSSVLNENLIAKISLKDGTDLFFKFNYMNKKILVFVRLEETVHKL
jgi:hypothetical protein